MNPSRPQRTPDPAFYANFVDPQRWWPRKPQVDWRTLPHTTVDRLVVWNLNLGRGQETYTVNGMHGRRLPFKPNAVASETAWVWHAADTAPPAAWGQLSPLGGIPSLIGLTVAGVPISAGIVLIPSGDTLNDFYALAEVVDREVTSAGGAWCPALVGAAAGERLAISLQQIPDLSAARRAAEHAAADSVVIVDPFGDRIAHAVGDPYLLVHGKPDGDERHVRSGSDGIGHIPLPDDLATFIDPHNTAPTDSEPTA
jgi:hypothetical protein